MKTLFKLNVAILIIIFVLPFVSESKEFDKNNEVTVQDAMNTIKWNQPVKIMTKTLLEIQGKKNEIVNDTLYLKSDSNLISVPFSDIKLIWAKENRGNKMMVTGAIIGGTIGFGVGMYFRDFSVMGPAETHNERPVIGALVGAGLGMMILGSIGSASHRWDERYSVNDRNKLSFNIIPDMNGGVYLKASVDL